MRSAELLSEDCSHREIMGGKNVFFSLFKAFYQEEIIASLCLVMKKILKSPFLIFLFVTCCHLLFVLVLRGYCP